MQISTRLVALSARFLVAALAPVTLAAAQPVEETLGYTLHTAASRHEALLVPASRRLGVIFARPPEVALAPLDARRIAAAERQGGHDPEVKVMSYAVPRRLAVTVVDGAWTALADGRALWVADLTSPAALALRLHFRGVSLPDGSELAIYEPAAGGAPVAAAEVHLGSPAERERDEIWSGLVIGERARVEYLAPAGASLDELPFRLDQLLHVYRDLVREAWEAKRAGACNNDVACYDELASVKRAVALVLMPYGACTGTLLADGAHDGAPYFLTANHCLSRQSDAAGTELVWFYETAACGANPPSLRSLPRSRGARIVSTGARSDYTLLMVKGALPPNPTFAGWTSDLPAAGTPSLVIHHPDGDFKRVSFGKVADDSRICRRAWPGRQLVRIDWTDGPTEPGSSGAGIFRADTQQLFGQLLGGPSSCGNETFDCFGAFATTYSRIRDVLWAAPDDSSEDNDSCRHARKVRPGTLAGRVAKLGDDDWYRMRVPAGKRVTVHLDFLLEDGAIELAGATSCASPSMVLGSSSGNADDVVLAGPGHDALPVTLYWRVRLAPASTRNSYAMTVSVQ